MQFSGTFRKVALSALVVSVGALSGCVVNGGGQADDGYYEEDSRGYPPARPRNGYRYAYPSGPSLIFDSGLGMYAVYGQPDYYFHDGYFYRWNSGNWNRSRYWNRRWERCDSRHWPRPIYQVNHNYYGRGKRPRHDWDRNDRDGRGEQHDGRGDQGGQPGEQHGGSPTPGSGHGGQGNGHGAGDVNGDGQRDRGERTMRGSEQVAREEQRRRELDQQLRERDPVDHRRQPDTDGARRPDQDPRAVRDAAIREQATRRSAERAAVEQRERGEQQAKQQAEHAQQRDAERQRDEARREEARDDGGDAERSHRGGARGDNWEDERGDRR